MTTRRRQRFIIGQVAWMLGAAVVLALLESLSLELFFVVSLIGLLIVIELTAAFSVTPTWRARLKWLVLLGLVGFTYVVVRRILEILPEGMI
jgi:membrane protein implicated in regulation of membrane protease activity